MKINLGKKLIRSSFLLGLSLGLLFIPTKVLAQEIKYCPEGQFYSIKDKVCLPLMMPSYGFQEFRNNKTQYTLPINCTPADFRKAVTADIDSSRGQVKVVQFPNSKCTINLDQVDKFIITPNTVIQGAGQGLTTIEGRSYSHTFGSGEDSFKLYAMFLLGPDQQNIVISNLTLDGKGVALKPFHVGGAKNILFDKLALNNFKESGLHCRRENGSNITMRYNTITNVVDFHGIACEDHNEKISLYSNLVRQTGDYGIDLHADKIEMAGNYVDKQNTGRGFKIPDTENLYFHHNHVVNAAKDPKGVRTYCEIKLPDNQVYFNNNIQSAGSSSFSLSLTGNLCPVNYRDDTSLVGAFVANNTIQGGINGEMKINACPDTTEASFATTVKNPLLIKMDDEAQPRDLCTVYKQYSSWIANGGYEDVVPSPIATVPPTTPPITDTEDDFDNPSKPGKPGDIDGNGVIDNNDFTILKQQFYQNGYLSADLNQDLIVDILDYAILAANYGKQVPQ